MEYEKFLSQATWPGDAAQEQLLTATKNKFPHLADQLDASKVLLVQVYYSTLISHTIQTQVCNKINQTANRCAHFKTSLWWYICWFQAAYDLLSLLSDIGGVFGFYMGLSIVALFEILELLADVLYLLCKSICVKNRVKGGQLEEKDPL